MTNPTFKLNLSVTDQQGNPLQGLTIVAHFKQNNNVVAEGLSDEKGNCGLSITDKKGRGKKPYVPQVYVSISEGKKELFRLDEVGFSEKERTVSLKIKLDEPVSVPAATMSSPAAGSPGQYEPFTLAIVLKDRKTNQHLPDHVIEAWYHHSDKADELLGKAQTGGEGQCHITFQWDSEVKKSRNRPVYCKVLKRDKPLYNSMEDGKTWWLVMNHVDILLQIPEQQIVHHLPDIPISVSRLDMDLSDLSGFSDTERMYIHQKLEAFLIDRLIESLLVDKEKAKAVIVELRLDLEAIKGQSFGRLFNETILPALKNDCRTREALSQQPLGSLNQSGTTVGEILQLDKPIKEHPVFFQDVRKVKTNVIAEIATGDPAIAIKLSERPTLWYNASEKEWQKLVEEGIVNEPQKVALQRTFNFGKLTGENFGLIKALRDDERLQQEKDLVHWEASDWETALDNADGETPNGEEKSAYIKNVMQAVERSFPTDYFMVRAIKTDTLAAKDNLTKISPLFTKNPDLLDAKNINWEGISAEQRTEIQQSLIATRAIAHTYRHLGMQEILSGQGTPSQRSKAAEQAIASLDVFYQNNPGMDLRTANFIKKPGTKESPFKWEGIREELQSKVQRQMLAFQRVRTIAPDYETSSKILASGLDSAYKITLKGRQGFGLAANLSKNEADRIFSTAQKKAAQAVQQYQSVVELHHNQQLGLTVDNTISHIPTGYGVASLGEGVPTQELKLDPSLYDQVRNELKEIDGFEDLFGPQNFCQCDHCKSIFSPAAYFVDLMHFVEVHGTDYSRIGSYPDALGYIDPDIPGPATDYPANTNHNHPLWLENRRPDLWNIDLTCECTYEMVPYLQIINGIKKAYIKKLWVLEGRYTADEIQQIDIYQALWDEQENHIFFDAPVSKAYRELQLLLEHYDLQLYEVKRLFASIDDHRFAYLKTLRPELQRPYGFNIFQLFGNRSSFDVMSVPDFLKHAKISRRELDAVLTTNYVQVKGNLQIIKSDFDEGIQFTEERLINITEESLTFLHYFIKLYRKLPWTIQELDLVFDAIGHINGSDPYSYTQVGQLSDLLKIQDALQISVEELIALVDVLPNKSIKSIERKDQLTGEIYQEQHPSFVEHTFQLDQIFGSNSTATINLDSEAEETPLAYLLSGLKTNRDIFLRLHAWLGGGNLIELNKNNYEQLSLYYRHVYLAKWLGLNQEEWFHVLSLNNNLFNEIEGILAFIEWVKDWQATPFSFEELRYLTDTSYNHYSVDTEAIRAALHLEKPMPFSRGLLTLGDLGLNDDDGHIDVLLTEMINNEVIIETADGNYQFTQKYDNQQLKAAVLAVDSAFSTNIWNTHGEVFQEALQPYHSLKAIAGLYFDQQALSAIGDLGEMEVAKLIELLTDAALIVTTVEGKYHKVTQAYGFNELETLVKSLPNSTDEENTIKSLLLNYLDSIHTFLQVHHPYSNYQEIWVDILSLTPERINTYQAFLNNDILPDFEKLASKLIDGIPAFPSDSFDFLDLLLEMEQLNTLFNKLGFEEVHLQFLTQHYSTIFGITNINSSALLNLDPLGKLLIYQEWIQLDKAGVELYLHPMLEEGYADKTKVVAAFQHYWEIPEHITLSLFNTYTNVQPVNPNDYIFLKYADNLKRLALMCKQLGITKDQLSLFRMDAQNNIQKLNKILYARIKTSFENEEAFEKAFEPIAEKIHELERDILCDYIMARSEVNFKDANELYAYFLLDPQMSGCMKISKMVAAHLSLQLYVQRTLMNLEQSNDGTFKAFLDPQVLQEWEWRKHYRVWEANRKVAVYPESFIEPEFRDNKSPEFKQLEEELLQQKITLESAEGAYKEYLKKFSELGKLVIAGMSYDEESGPYPMYHIIGRTITDPYVYYYRKFQQIGGDSWEWTAWERIEATINSSNVAPITHNGRLYLVWSSVVIQGKTAFQSGSSVYQGHDYKATIGYTFKDHNDKWFQPQQFTFPTPITITSSNPNYSPFEQFRGFSKIYPYNYNNFIHFAFLVGTSYTEYSIQSGKIDLYTNDIFPTGYYQNLSPEPVVELHVWENWNSFIALREVSESNETQLDLFKYLYIDSNYNSRSYTAATSTFAIDNGEDCNIIYNRPNESLLKYDNNFFLIKKNEPSTWKLVRLSSSVIRKLDYKLYREGVNSFLSIETQTFSENQLDFSFTNPSILLPLNENQNQLSFQGAYGEYFRELFFHIPSLIADHLNAEGKYKDADWWYRRIFDPTAPMDDHVDPSRPVDRNWQYIEFRNQNFPKYSVDLTDPAFLEVYKKDPFNPHAIARLRLSAYQKATVLKYIDNLLDWGDSLFRKDTFESINEAMMLYILAQDILGERPKELCKCKTAADEELTYSDVSQSLGEGSDFLIWMENQHQVMTHYPEPGMDTEGDGTETGNEGGQGNNTATGSSLRVSSYENPKEQLEESQSTINQTAFNHAAREGRLMAMQSNNKLVFCVPMNKRILDLWDRVEDRLFKIRHCMNIDGVKRSLSLFAPVIDPALLVAAHASGLSIADAIASLDAPVPNYRFSYMLEKAKSYVGTVQSFGGALLSALEKKDSEELTLLRSVHEQNILKMTKDIKQQQIEESKVQIKNLEETKKNVEYRVEYYSGLIEVGLIPWERTQQKATHAASILYGVEAVFGTLASLLSLIPNVGAPTAMTYGGMQVSRNVALAGNAINSAAKAANLLATSAGYEAGNQRREQEWKNQLKLSQQELKAIDQQILAAQIRLAIAEKDLQIHETQIEQAKELYDFYKNKFTNLNLYKYMATTLNRLYSQAFNLAFDMAKKAEKCYQFETDDASTFFIQNDNWDSGFAGLLAGERLQLQLMRMEKAFIEKTPRRDEITQSFSLRMLNPEGLANLQKNGECSFVIPEWAFDVYYPGHYRRTIKSVRITIPCVAGPYTNVSCRLSLIRNQIRTKPSLNEPLYAGPNFANGAISTSTASNDGGQFELNFQDARYLPFEGGGAVSSEWTLSLPSAFRTFDYKSISDAIVHISYSALYDSTLRSLVETDLSTQLSTVGTLKRFVSFREEFPDLLYQLETSGAAKLTLSVNQFPFFAKDKIFSIETLFYWNGSSFQPDSSSMTNNQDGTWKVDLQNLPVVEGDIILLITYTLTQQS